LSALNTNVHVIQYCTSKFSKDIQANTIVYIDNTYHYIILHTFFTSLTTIELGKRKYLIDKVITIITYCIYHI